MLGCPIGTHPIYCDVLVRLSLNSVPYTCINTWIFLCTEVYPLINSLIVLFGNWKENQSNPSLVQCWILCLGYVVTIGIKNVLNHQIKECSYFGENLSVCLQDLCHHDFYFAKGEISSKDWQKNEHFWWGFPASGRLWFWAVVFFFSVILILISGKLSCKWLGVVCD